MRKSVKVWLIVATLLVFLGALLFAGMLFSAGWDFSKLATTEYATMSYEIDEEFSNISINTDTADVHFELSQDGNCKVVCFEDVKESFEVKVEENTLVIKKNTNKAWYDYIGINFSSPKITVYLPVAELNSMDINLSTGDLFISDITCDTLVSRGSTGEVKLKNTVANNKIDIKRSTGDIEFSGCDSAEIYISTATGDVEGTLLSPKVFITKTSTGKILVPETNAGGRCEITTSTGDIEIEVNNGI